MDRIESINTERIKWCCAERGTSLDEVAAATGISNSTFRRVMEGKGGLTFRQLQNLAAYFNRGVLFFLEPGRVNERRLSTPQFRTLTSQKPRDRLYALPAQPLDSRRADADRLPTFV